VFWISNRYVSGTPPTYWAEEFVTTSTRLGVEGFVPLIGDTGVGALTLSVDPSAVALALAAVVAEGDAGLGDFLLQLNVRAARMASVMRKYGRVINTFSLAVPEMMRYCWVVGSNFNR
jgi:hypothetical protein